MSSPDPYLRQPFKPSLHARRLAFNDNDMVYPSSSAAQDGSGRLGDPIVGGGASRTLFPSDLAAITPLGKNSPWVK